MLKQSDDLLNWRLKSRRSQTPIAEVGQRGGTASVFERLGQQPCPDSRMSKTLRAFCATVARRPRKPHQTFGRGGRPFDQAQPRLLTGKEPKRIDRATRILRSDPLPIRDKLIDRAHYPTGHAHLASVRHTTVSMTNPADRVEIITSVQHRRAGQRLRRFRSSRRRSSRA